MQKIEGDERNLLDLLKDKKYTIHYYQREYRWQEKQIRELIDDLTTEFITNYQPNHTRSDVAEYSAYFMGSIVIAGKENAIIDGQQRLSSLTLLLMYLNNRLRDIGQSHEEIAAMIFSSKFGKKSFNINIPERQACMEAIYNDKLDNFDRTNASESVQNLCDRYEDIVKLFPQNDITDDMLLNFCDWLAEKIFFIKIIAKTEQDAHKIFVTMNDRGLNLTSLEMLKGYLLSEVKNDDKRKEFNDKWKKMVLDLRQDSDKGDEIFIRAWLRAQYAETIRDKQAGAKNGDYDIIGGQFHEWVRDNNAKLCLNTAADFEAFIEKIFYFAKVYQRILDAEKTFAEPTKYIYCNAQVNFTLQPQMLMASICHDDKAEIVTEKINLTARFIDLLICARVTNKKSLAFNTIKDSIFGITKSIRRLTVDALKTQLDNKFKQYCNDLKLLDFVDAIPEFGLNQQNKRYVKNILARITSFIERKIPIASNYVEYMNTETKNPFEIEHILCDHFERFTSEFTDKEEFNRYRNSIGALLLLRKKINASLSDKNYSDKLATYCSTQGNIYAASLGEQAYKNNTGFKQFIDANNLSFKYCDKFGKDEIQHRIAVVIQLANLIWNTKEFQ